MTMPAKTMFDKIWERHAILEEDDETLLYVDRCLLHEGFWWNIVDALKARGVLISNFYNTPTPGFRVGCIGAISPPEMRHAVATMAEALNELGINRRRAA